MLFYVFVLHAVATGIVADRQAHKWQPRGTGVRLRIDFCGYSCETFLGDCLFTIALLAGGIATRLRPITEKIPKSLLEVNGAPFIVHQFRLLRASGIHRVVLCVGFLGEQIQEAIADGSKYGLEVEYSFDGDTLLGTAGALKRALPLLGDSFFVLYGDSYLACDYAAIGKEFTSCGLLALMTVYKNEGQWDTSNVEFEDGRILAYSKKNRTPRMRHIDYGLGVFSAKAMECVPAGETYDLAELYGAILDKGQLAGMEVHQRFYEIGSPAGLEETANFLASERVKQR
jgi:NDP-sugar pyrophosphorylase family protein